jgi:Ca2+-binding EF-hand superfamily protein
VFDEDHDAVIPTNLLGKLLRAVGFNPYPEEVEDMIEEIEKNNDPLNFAASLYVLRSHARAVDPEGELVDEFRVFDKDGKGKLKVETIRNILKGIKQPFTDDQITELISQAEVDSGNCIASRDFVKLMLDF